MTYVQFVLVCEGPTDIPLTNHLENLLIWVGADEVNGSAPNFSSLKDHEGYDVASKLDTAVKSHPGANLIVIHRDADASDPTPRYEEIEEAVDEVGVGRSNVAVVPVQETEAWLLLDEQAIKRAAANPNSNANLGLPRPAQVEQVASPKDRLYEALLEASGTTGYRRERVRKRLPNMAAQLLRRLPIDGPVQQLPAWQRLRDDLEDAIRYL